MGRAQPDYERNPGSGSVARLKTLKVVGPLRRVAAVKRHLAPIHPGTGTDQSVHAGGNGGTSGVRDLSIPDDIRGMTFYHATSDQEVGEEIIRDAELQASAEAGGRAFMSPVAGKVYATSDPEYALIYALGGDMAGTQSSDWTRQQIEDKGRYSYIFEVNSDSLNRIQPDEDSIGEAISNDTYDWLTRLAEERLSHNQLRKVMDGEYAYWAQTGKKLVQVMSDEQKFEMIRDGSHIANEGGLSLGKVWRIDKLDLPNFQQYDYDGPDTEARRSTRVAKIWELAELVQRHKAPIHPGTGTDQSVHAGGDGGNRGGGGVVDEEKASRGTLYRGMRRELLDDILENGFDPSKAVAWRDRPSAVYLTEDQALAAEYGVAREIAKLLHEQQKYLAVTHAGRQLTWGVVFEVDVPAGFSLRDDTEQEGEGHYFTTETIPPDWIVGYREASLDVDDYAVTGVLMESINLGELVERAEEGTRKLYIGVAYGDSEEVVERHGKHQDQAGVPGQKGGSAPGYTHVGAQPEGEGGGGKAGFFEPDVGQTVVTDEGVPALDFGGFDSAMEMAQADLEQLGMQNFTPVGAAGGKAVFLNPSGETVIYNTQTGKWEAAPGNADEILEELKLGGEFGDTPITEALEAAAGTDKASIEQASIDAARASIEEIISPEAVENFRALGANEDFAVFELVDNGDLKVFNVNTGKWEVFDQEPKDADQLLFSLDIITEDEMGIVFEEGQALAPMLPGESSPLPPIGTALTADEAVATDPAFEKAYTSLVAITGPDAMEIYSPVGANDEFAVFTIDATDDLIVWNQETEDWEKFDEQPTDASKLLFDLGIDQKDVKLEGVGGEQASLREGNASLETYADVEGDVKSASRAIRELGLGETGGGHSGASDTQYVHSMMFDYDLAIRKAGYHVDDQLQPQHQNDLKMVLDAIEYESDRLGVSSPEIKAAIALNATMEYPSLESVMGKPWNPDYDFALDGLENPQEIRAVQMAVMSELTNMESLGNEPGLNPSNIQMWTARGNISRETSEQLYANYLVRLNTEGTPENKMLGGDSSDTFEQLTRVIAKDRYSWVPRDEGPELETAANSINRGWQVTTSSPSAILLTEVVAAEHGGTPIPRENYDENRFRVGPDSLGPDIFRSPERQDEFAEVAEQIYARTQQQLADAGLQRTDTVRLYRGMDATGNEDSWNPNGVDNGLVEVDMYALSSWTPSVRIAARFSGRSSGHPTEGGGWLLAADIPVQRLWANADTGPPSKGEDEWMVLGLNGIEGAIMSTERMGEIGSNISAIETQSTLVGDHFDEVLASKAERPTISPDLTHMMWMTQIAEDETGLDSTKFPVKDIRDAEFTEHEETLARARAGLEVVERHGEHIGQEGTPEGGSQPGYTHVPGSVGGSGEWSPSGNNHIDYGPMTASDKQNPPWKEEYYIRSVVETLESIREKTGVEVSGLRFSTRLSAVVDAIIEKRNWPDSKHEKILDEMENRLLGNLLDDKSTAGMYENGVVWSNKNLDIIRPIGSPSFRQSIAHEVGHHLVDTMLEDTRKTPTESYGHFAFSTITPSKRYRQSLEGFYPQFKITEEYIVDLFSTMALDGGEKHPYRFHRLGVSLDSDEIKDLEALRVIVNEAQASYDFVERSLVSRTEKLVIYFNQSEAWVDDVIEDVPAGVSYTIVERHEAPIHPGTGTDQGVHAGGVVTESPEQRKWSPDLTRRVMDFTAQRYEKLPASEATAPFQYGAVWILPDGQIIRVGDAHENYRKVLFKEFGEEDFPGRQADFREVGPKEIRSQGFVRFSYIPNTYRGERSIYFDLDLKAITPTAKQAMRDIFWSVHTVEEGPPNVTFDWHDDDGKYQSFTTTDAGGGTPGTLRELRRAIGFKIDRSLVSRHLAPIHPGTGTDQSVHSPTGQAAQDHSEGPDSFDNLAGDFMTVTLDRNNPDTLVKLLKFTPEVDEEGNVDLEAVGTWDVEIITGPSSGYVEPVSDYDLDPAPMGTEDVWTTDESVGATLERAEGIFGITESMSESGYILPDGALLDFSGGEGGEGSRALDHRQISQVLLEDQGGEEAKSHSGGMIYFMGHTGAIRTSYFGGKGVTFTLDIARQPTQAQWRTILEWSDFTDELILDLSDPVTGANLWSNTSLTQNDPEAAIRELREAAQGLEGARVTRMVIRSKNAIPEDVSEAMDELMLALRALSTGDLGTFIRTRWSDYNSHLQS